MYVQELSESRNKYDGTGVRGIVKNNIYDVITKGLAFEKKKKQ